jgi:hypothetical protein
MTGRGARSPGQDLDADLRGRVVRAGPHPGHVHVTTDGDLVLPGPGPAGRREHARQLRPGQAITPIAAHRAGPLCDGLLDLPAHRARPKIDDRERPEARFRAQAFN